MTSGLGSWVGLEIVVLLVGPEHSRVDQRPFLTQLRHSGHSKGALEERIRQDAFDSDTTLEKPS